MQALRRGPIAVVLSAALILASCAPTIVQVKRPYHTKVRPGDGVKVLTKDGTTFSGRVTYVDQSLVVIVTPKQVIQRHPVESARFGTSIPWETVHTIRVAGTLDSDGRLISNEEIRVNRKSNLRQKMLINVGLMGLAAGFLAGARIQESIAPADPTNLKGSHGKGRLAFWTTVLGTSGLGLAGGYKLGSYMDRGRAIDRIERFRARLKAHSDSLTANSTQKSTFPNVE